MLDSTDTPRKSIPLSRVADAQAPIVYGIVQPGDDHPGGIPFVQSRDVGGPIDFDSLQRTTPDIAAQYHRSRISAGDILFSLRGNIGQSSLTPPELEGANIARGIARIRVGKTHHCEFVRYVLQGPSLEKVIARNANGSTFREISIEELRKLPFPAVSFPEQRKIAEILRTWDAAIEKMEGLRDVKQRRQRALTRALVFGSLRLNGFQKSDQAVPYRWFTLPTDWTSKAIGKVAAEVSDRQGGADAAEVLSCSKHLGFVRSLEYFKKQVFSSDLANYKRIWRNDFGFPSNHVEEGSIGLQNLVDVGVVSPIYTVFRFAPDKVDPRYAYAVLKTGLYRHIFEVSTSASVDRRGSLRWSEFSKLPFPLPPLAEQRAIVEVLQTASADIAGLGTEIETLTRQKRGLMQKLLTGEWRVKVGDGNV